MSLLSALAKLLETITLKQIINMSSLIHNLDSVPNTILHQILYKISSSFVHKKCYPDVFLDVSQTFNKVWHTILLLKSKKIFLTPLYLLVQFYFSNHIYFVRQGFSFFSFFKIHTEVPQGSSFTIPLKYSVHFRHS